MGAFVEMSDLGQFTVFSGMTPIRPLSNPNPLIASNTIAVARQVPLPRPVETLSEPSGRAFQTSAPNTALLVGIPLGLVAVGALVWAMSR
jgi:hypothetical protein